MPSYLFRPRLNGKAIQFQITSESALKRRHSKDDVNLSANKLGGSYRSIHFISKARDAICKVLVTFVQ